MGRFTNFLTGIFLTLLIVQMIPSTIKSLKDNYENIFDLKAKVGLIVIKNEIDDIGNYLKNLRKFFENNEIKAILLKIESPGGAAGSSQALYNEILNFKKEHPKPVITLSNDLCASGAYYVACASDYIIASPGSLIGSIGSYLGVFKIKDLLENWKIKYSVCQSGKYKTALNPFTEMTQEMQEFIQTVSDDVYKQFLNDVAARRKLSVAQTEKWANGKFFTGKQAFELGLIDELGSEINAERKIRELAMIEKEKKIDWVKPSKTSKYEQLFGNEEDNIEALINRSIDRICSKFGIKQNSKIMMN